MYLLLRGTVALLDVFIAALTRVHVLGAMQMRVLQWGYERPAYDPVCVHVIFLRGCSNNRR